MGYMDLSAAAWQQEYDKVSAEYESWKAKGLKLNMARGKPSKQQLDLVSGILTALTSAEECVDSGVDARNYGELKGLESARKLFADILGCKTSQVFAGGNSSLQLMYDTVSKAYTHGLLHSGARYAVTDQESATECIVENKILRRIAPHCVEEHDGLFITLPEDDLAYQQLFVDSCLRAGIRAEIIDPKLCWRWQACGSG